MSRTYLLLYRKEAKKNEKILKDTFKTLEQLKEESRKKENEIIRNCENIKRELQLQKEEVICELNHQHQMQISVSCC